MNKKPKLSEIVDSMDCQTGEMSPFLNRETGKIEMLSAELISAIEDDEDPEEAIDTYGGAGEDIPVIQEIIKGDKWLALPSKFDINDYSIMENFCLSRKDPSHQDQLLSSIKGREAFGRFRGTVEALGLLDKWHAFKKESYMEIAKDWCEENGVECE
jgi:hypothetical protein